MAVLGVLAGCSLNDPTENEFAPRIVNDTRSTATVAYCGGSSSCKPYLWTEKLARTQRTEDSINAGRGNLSVFLVTQGGRFRCIRLANYTDALRLSGASRSACHPPYR